MVVFICVEAESMVIVPAVSEPIILVVVFVSVVMVVVVLDESVVVVVSVEPSLQAASVPAIAKSGILFSCSCCY